MTDLRTELGDAARALVPAAILTRDGDAITLLCATIAEVGALSRAELMDRAPILLLRLGAVLRGMRVAGTA